MKKIIYLTITFFLLASSISLAKMDALNFEVPGIFMGGIKGKSDDQIIHEIWSIIDEEPYNYKNYIALAFFYDQKEDYKNELKALQALVAYLPEDAESKGVYYGNLGRAYMLNDRWEEGMLWVRKADAIDDQNAYNRWLAFDYYLPFKKDYKAAALELVKLEKISHEGWDVYYQGYSKTIDYLTDQKETIKMFEEVVRLDPDNNKAHRALGTAIRNASLKNYEEAMPLVMAEFNKALELDPGYILTYISISNAYMFLERVAGKEGGYEEALKWLDKAYAIDPEDERVTFSYGTLLVYMKLYDRAIEKLEVVWEQERLSDEARDSLATAYNNMAYGFYQAGENLEEGLELVNKALKLEPQNGIIISTKAELLYKLGRYEEAYEYIQRAIALEPEEKEIQQDMAMIEAALQEKKK